MTIHHGQMDATGLRVALVCSRFNDLVVGRLEAGARDALVRHGAADADIDTVWVPGALEIPQVAKALSDTGRYDAIVALAAVIRGATYHFEVVCNQSAAGLQRLAMESTAVVTNGILTVDTLDQALERAGSKAGNKGADVALAAIETVNVLRRLS
jgi:6,7-dimethyl-8-ribityllumazine synthase